MKKAEVRPKLRGVVRALLLVAVIAGLGAVAIWGFVEGRQELAQEAERERPVKPPQRISIRGNEVVITLDAAGNGAAELGARARAATRRG